MISLELFLAEKGIYMLTFILMGLGLFGMIVCGNYKKKIITAKFCNDDFLFILFH